MLHLRHGGLGKEGDAGLEAEGADRVADRPHVLRISACTMARTVLCGSSTIGQSAGVVDHEIKLVVHERINLADGGGIVKTCLRLQSSRP